MVGVTVPSKLKVMVVDDDRVSVEILAATLETFGHQVVRRYEALGTLLALKREKPDLLVLDVQMPGITGPQLARAIRSGNDSPPTDYVFYSGSPPEALAILVEEHAALGAVVKSTDVGCLGKAFAPLLARVGERLAAQTR